MSDRIHIGATDDPLYDCVIENKNSIIALGAGPYKIRIGDLDLYREIEPHLAAKFEAIGVFYPDQIWAFYSGNRTIVHPSKFQLSDWLDNAGES